MKKKSTLKIRLILPLFLVLGAVCSPIASAKNNDLPYDTYTYTSNGSFVYTPPTYTVESINIADNNGKRLNFPTDYCLDKQGNFIITDKGNKRIVAFDDNFNFLWEMIDGNFNGEKIKIYNPNSVSLDNQGNYYIADEGESDEAGTSLGSGRIIKLDPQRNIIKIFEKPDVKTFDKNYNYNPQRIAVDDSGRMYVIAKNINQGFMQLDRDGKFKGFLGAPKVTYDPLEIIMRTFSTKAQIAKMEIFIPTEYKNVDIDKYNFLYVTTATNNKEQIHSMIYDQIMNNAEPTGKSELVRRLNPSGVDILKRQGVTSPIGDIKLPNLNMAGSPIVDVNKLSTSEANVAPSIFEDVKAIDAGIYLCLDSSRSRIFTYDKCGNLLFSFGCNGSRKESFSTPVAIEYKNEKIYLLNQDNSTVTVCTPTDYCKNLFSLISLQESGDFEESIPHIKKVLQQNANCEYAYDSLGKMYMNQDDYQNAMQMFKLAGQKSSYSTAFKYQRSAIVEKNFIIIIVTIISSLIAFFFLSRLIKRTSQKKGKFATVCKNIKFIFHIMVHPFDGFWDLKHENRGSLHYALILLVILGITSVIKTTGKSYIFNNLDLRYVNVVMEFITVILPFLIFALANWCLTTLMDGKGTLKDIIKFIGYSTVPMIISNVVCLLLSYVLCLDEGMILGVFSGFGTIYTLFLIFCGMLSTHDFTLKKTILTTIFSVCGIVVIVFIGLFLINIFQQIVEFIKLIAVDISLR